MAKLFYPIAKVRLTHENWSNARTQLWGQTALLPEHDYVGVYYHYSEDGHECDFAIASEMPNDAEPVVIEELTWYDKTLTSEKNLEQTWQSIVRKARQGMLPRALSVDFEKRLPDGKIELYIAVRPHC
ncbi:AraC family transcriptional regulator [Pasteurellaceae bacterium HPA106]|uniref:AraC family transcriptional regulator n=1 Tax=Spirabiliibacterium pneumoniae TaxID=221400 RepID=UPI001AAD82E7|nr:AraC family transcriptional regulator [Spirabiliibacterium pneumoniae]MBE2896388.1 AraC family transcriptional regulator [Spirabiliibacterium pneumoniae]